MLALYAIKQCIASTLYASYISNCLYPGIRWRMYTIHKLIKSSSYIHLHFIVYCQHLVQKEPKGRAGSGRNSLLQINIIWATATLGVLLVRTHYCLSTIPISCRCCLKSLIFFEKLKDLKRSNLLCLIEPIQYTE